VPSRTATYDTSCRAAFLSGSPKARRECSARKKGKYPSARAIAAMTKYGGYRYKIVARADGRHDFEWGAHAASRAGYSSLVKLRSVIGGVMRSAVRRLTLGQRLCHRRGTPARFGTGVGR
jgi:hypothetical protein